MPLRKIQPIFDDLSPQTSYRLDMSLADYLPSTKYAIAMPPKRNKPKERNRD